MKKVSAKKHFGQHFLNKPSIAESIVNQLEFKNKDLLEIGPGTGNLTSYILKKNPKNAIIQSLSYVNHN